VAKCAKLAERGLANLRPPPELPTESEESEEEQKPAAHESGRSSREAQRPRRPKKAPSPSAVAAVAAVQGWPPRGSGGGGGTTITGGGGATIAADDPLVIAAGPNGKRSRRSTAGKNPSRLWHPGEGGGLQSHPRTKTPLITKKRASSSASPRSSVSSSSSSSPTVTATAAASVPRSRGSSSSSSSSPRRRRATTGSGGRGGRGRRRRRGQLPAGLARTLRQQSSPQETTTLAEPLLGPRPAVAFVAAHELADEEAAFDRYTLSARSILRSAALSGCAMGRPAVLACTPCSLPSPNLPHACDALMMRRARHLLATAPQ
jgi:hypothetical protein